MSQVANTFALTVPAPPRSDARRFTGVALGWLAISALLCRLVPLQMSIATVFLFAGPHNWMEFRYFLSRVPVRLARMRGFFAIGASGVAALAGLHISLPVLASYLGSTDRAWLGLIATWNGLLITWVIALVYARSRRVPQFDWTAALPIGLALLAADVLAPGLWGLGLVYLHPLVALWFLDRQLRRSRPQWLRAYRICLIAVPLLAVSLWLGLSGVPALAADNGLSLRITLHAGADLLPGLNARALVATHTFLETIHYGIWIFALPLLGLQAAPWRTATIPLVRHRLGWPRLIRMSLVIGGFAMAVLWGCFAVNYSTTRDVYFTVAIVHVLAEVPFLIRMA